MRRCCLLILLLVPAVARAQLVSPAKEERLRALMPPVADEQLAQRLAGPLVFYTNADLPPAYQQNGQWLRVTNRGDDGNFRFPWREPGGLHRCEFAGFRFLSLPVREADERWPVVFFRGKLDSARDQQANSTVWTFPVGTIVGEVLTMRHAGADFPFLLRVREREIDDWHARQFAPFPTAESLAQGIEIVQPNTASQAIARLRAPVPGDKRASVLSDRGIGDRDRPMFAVRSGTFEVPELWDELVVKLLDAATFEEMVEPFKRGGEVSAMAPSNRTGKFNIVPPNFAGTFAGIDRQSCMRCHETVGMAQVRFDDSWRGHVRGSDGIFSFRPMTIADGKAGQPIQQFLDAGVIAPLDPALHPDTVYRSIPKLRHLPRKE